MNIKFVKMKQGAKIPKKRKEDAGLDIYACFDDDFVEIEPHKTIMVPTGLASVIESGYFVKLMERGSTGSKGIGLHCGVVDSNYRGEWFVAIENTTNNSIFICKEHYDSNKLNGLIYPYEKAICQAVVLPVPEVEIEQINISELENYKTERGFGKLGSSGK